MSRIAGLVVLAAADGARRRVPASARPQVAGGRPSTDRGSAGGGAAATVDPLRHAGGDRRPAPRRQRRRRRRRGRRRARRRRAVLVRHRRRRLHGHLRRRAARSTRSTARESAPAAFTETLAAGARRADPVRRGRHAAASASASPARRATWETALNRYGIAPAARAAAARRAARARGLRRRRDACTAQTEDNAERFADFTCDRASSTSRAAQPIQAGATLRNPDLADTMELIGRRARTGFYRGAVARDIVADRAHAAGGARTRRATCARA